MLKTVVTICLIITLIAVCFYNFMVGEEYIYVLKPSQYVDRLNRVWDLLPLPWEDNQSNSWGVFEPIHEVLDWLVFPFRVAKSFMQFISYLVPFDANLSDNFKVYTGYSAFNNYVYDFYHPVER